MTPTLSAAAVLGALIITSSACGGPVSTGNPSLGGVMPTDGKNDSPVCPGPDQDLLQWDGTHQGGIEFLPKVCDYKSQAAVSVGWRAPGPFLYKYLGTLKPGHVEVKVHIDATNGAGFESYNDGRVTLKGETYGSPGLPQVVPIRVEDVLQPDQSERTLKVSFDIGEPCKVQLSIQGVAQGDDRTKIFRWQASSLSVVAPPMNEQQ
jgi:hypothetical protein